MEDPKTSIYAVLTGLTGVDVYANRPDIVIDVETTPVVTFYISNNVPEYCFEKTRVYQDVQVVIDIWAKTSSISGGILVDLETLMLASDYRLTFATDILEDNGYSHISTRFESAVFP